MGCAAASHTPPAPSSLHCANPHTSWKQRQARTVLQAADAEDQQVSQSEQQAQPSAPHIQQPPIPSSNPEASSSSSGSHSANGMYSVMTALAAAGALETSYLTATKLLNTTAACPTNGCDTVLNSAFGTLFGLPLPLYGAATYSAVAVAAGLAAAAVSSGKPVPGWLSTGLAAGVAVLATTSASLMAILHTQLGGANCVWCYASAGLSAGLFAALIAGMDRRQMADAAGPGLGGTAAAVAALYLGFGSSLTGNAAELELTYANPIVTTQSSDQALSLAHRLKEAGAKMYGAFWCTHCYDQKQEFGQQAMAEFPYVECFPEGWKKVGGSELPLKGSECRAFAIAMACCKCQLSRWLPVCCCPARSCIHAPGLIG